MSGNDNSQNNQNISNAAVVSLNSTLLLMIAQLEILNARLLAQSKTKLNVEVTGTVKQGK